MCPLSPLNTQRHHGKKRNMQCTEERRCWEECQHQTQNPHHTLNQAAVSTLTHQHRYYQHSPKNHTTHQWKRIRRQAGNRLGKNNAGGWQALFEMSDHTMMRDIKRALTLWRQQAPDLLLYPARHNMQFSNENHINKNHILRSRTLRIYTGSGSKRFCLLPKETDVFTVFMKTKYRDDNV